MMIWRNGFPYIVSYSDVGFAPGTAMWFYNSAAPAGWEILAIPGDAMLGVVDSSGANQFINGGSQLYSGVDGTGTGSWKMTADQLVPHIHHIVATFTNGGGKYSKLLRGDKNNLSEGRETDLNVAPNYGNWRPVTAIGIIAQKL
jgi:hypothetical protein